MTPTQTLPPVVDPGRDAAAPSPRPAVLALRLSARGRSTLADLLVLLPLLIGIAVLKASGMFRSPARIDDEGTYVAQAWAVLNLGELTHYTYWWDHPPLGWLQIAGYALVTDAFDRAPNAVGAGRELTLVLAVVSAALLWVLARRLDMPRWGAALAVVLFAASPIAVEYQRYVFLDNVATPWLLGSFVLALSPRRRLAAFAGAAFCFGIAVLTKETTLLLLPVLAWVVWRQSAGGTRRYAVTVSTAVLTLTGLFYVAFALVKGEVVPSTGQTSLVDGVAFQLLSRESSGSIFTAGTLGNDTVARWLTLDLVLPGLAIAATLPALLVRRLRPFAVGMLILLTMLVRPGYLPVPFVIAMLPLGALLVAGVAVAMARWSPARMAIASARSRGRGRAGRVSGRLLARPLVPVVLVVLAAGAGVAAVTWQAPLRSSLIGPLDQPLTDATEYVAENAEPGQRVLTDDALWVDLVDAGLRREDVVWFYKPDTDPDVPAGVDSYSWVVATDSVRNSAGGSTVPDALEQGVRVATFGTGDQRVDVLRLLPGGAAAADPAQGQARELAGATLAGNPRLEVTEDAAAALTAGQVDTRLMGVLAVATTERELGVDLPVTAGEQDAGQLRRVLVVDRLDGAPLTEGTADDLALLFSAQQDGLAADVDVLPVQRSEDAFQLRVTYDLRPVTDG